MDEAREIGCVLEQSNRRDSRCAHSEAARGVLESDATNGKNGDFHAAAHDGEPLKTLGRAMGSFRGRSEDGSKEDVIGSCGGSGLRGFGRMAGSADKKIAL